MIKTIIVAMVFPTFMTLAASVYVTFVVTFAEFIHFSGNSPRDEVLG
jgi:hypothetical protein